jgi:hypothetical protein
MTKRSYEAAFGPARVLQLCVQCKTPQSLDKFPTNRKGREKTCKTCALIRRTAYYETLHGYLIKLLNDSRASTKRRINVGRAHHHDIDIGYLEALWRAQGGTCALSGMPMSHKPMTKWQASLDRIDDNRGYVQDNVRFICLELNSVYSIKDSATLWRIFAGQMDLPVLNVAAELARVHARPASGMAARRPPLTMTSSDPQRSDTPTYLCTKCNQHLSPYHFWKDITKGCRSCQQQTAAAYRNTMRGRVRALVSHAHDRAAARGQKRALAGQCTLTFNDVVNMYQQQQGRCYYSGLPLRFESGSRWLMSLERLDTAYGYHRENCALVCYCFNVGDQSAKRPGFDNGILGWSKAKFEEMRDMVLQSRSSYALSHTVG